MAKSAGTFALLLLGLAGLCWGQSDIRINARGPYIDLGRALTWAGSGPGAVNNAYIFSPSSPDVGTCLFVSNNATGSHTFTPAIYHSGDQRQVAFTGNTTAWVQDLPSSLAVVTGAGNAGASSGYYVAPSGAARIAVSISGGSGAGTVDLYVVSTTASSCSGAVYGTPSGVGCSIFAPITFTSSGVQSVYVNTSATKKVHVCFFAASMSASTTLSIGTGTGGVCVDGVTNLASFPNVSSVALDLPNLNMAGIAGGDVCVTTTSTVTGGGVIGVAVY